MYRKLVTSALAILLITSACGQPAAPRVSAPATLIRIGWQVPWATQGQITQVLKHTNVLEMNGLRGEFKGFSYGGPLNEAAMAGDVDVIFTADQPAAMLLARGARWKIVTRLMFNRVALYVPPDSPLKSVADLKGKRIAMPFGAAAQREALKAIKAAGLDPARDIQAINLDIYEQSSVIQAGTRQSWGNIDAMAGFDPTPAIFEHEGVARMLHIGSVVSLVVMSEDFIQRDSEAAKNFLKAFIEAYYYYATHTQQADTWFRNESRLTFDPAVLELTASVEPNVKAKQPEDIDVWLREEHIQRMQEGADFIFEQGLTKTRVEMKKHIDLMLLQQALDELRALRDDFFRIQAK